MRLWSGICCAPWWNSFVLLTRLTMLTSVNIKPAVFFLLPVGANPGRWQDPLCCPYIRGERAIACSEALTRWLQVPKEKSNSQMVRPPPPSFTNTQQCSLGDPSWAALLLACNLQVSRGLVCCSTVRWGLAAC